MRRYGRKRSCHNVRHCGSVWVLGVRAVNGVVMMFLLHNYSAQGTRKLRLGLRFGVLVPVWVHVPVFCNVMLCGPVNCFVCVLLLFLCVLCQLPVSSPFYESSKYKLPKGQIIP
jgi:hypothetical protein